MMYVSLPRGLGQHFERFLAVGEEEAAAVRADQVFVEVVARTELRLPRLGRVGVPEAQQPAIEVCSFK